MSEFLNILNQFDYWKCNHIAIQWLNVIVLES
jgi:hypothetical protein|nr:MAG TPA: hypothetical protein [Caudoviricetes sp.]